VILDDFQPYILPSAKGCPGIIANLNTRLAIIELCQKSMLWREYQTPIATVALQTAYAYAPAANQQVCTLLSMTLDGAEVGVIDPATGKMLDADSYTGNYAYGGFSGFELHPAQAADLSIVTYATVAPSLTATTVPDSLGKYIEAIANGALSRILAAKDKAYSDPAGALIAKLQWEAAIEDAKSDAQRGSARVVTRTRKVWF
jgi:hypothetical protein